MGSTTCAVYSPPLPSGGHGAAFCEAAARQHGAAARFRTWDGCACASALLRSPPRCGCCCNEPRRTLSQPWLTHTLSRAQERSTLLRGQTTCRPSHSWRQGSQARAGAPRGWGCAGGWVTGARVHRATRGGSPCFANARRRLTCGANAAPQRRLGHCRRRILRSWTKIRPRARRGRGCAARAAPLAPAPCVAFLTWLATQVIGSSAQ